MKRENGKPQLRIMIYTRQMHHIIKYSSIVLCCAAITIGAAAVPDVTRMWFTPPVIPLDFTGSISFEATVTESPTSVMFEYNGVDRVMYDDGTHGDLVPADGTWTTIFQANEILTKLTPSRVYRPFIGYCKPGGGSRYSIFAEIWTPDIGIVDVRPLSTNAQETDYLVNFKATKSQLMSFSASYWANQFYSVCEDSFDFIQFVHIAGKRGNRYHSIVKNSVQGIGLNIYDNSATFGSSGRLKGYTVYPLSNLFDCGVRNFNHEIGHQWINFLSGTPFSSGISHWPKGDVAINIMGFSLQGGAGGRYYYTFTPDGQGGFHVGTGNGTNSHSFNNMELYLMGLVPAAEVGTFFVLKNQNLNLTVGQTLQFSDITLVTVDDVISAKGVRTPASANAQSTFRCATVVLSEQLLDVHAVSFYDWFARRAEAKQQLSYASGFATGTSNPFYVATGARAVMFSKIANETPTLNISWLANDQFSLSFLGKLGIQYQPQVSSNLVTWVNMGPPVLAPLIQPSGDNPVSVTVTTSPGMSTGFWRVECAY